MFKNLCKPDYYENELKPFSEKEANSHLCYKCRKCEGTGLKDFRKGGHWSGEFCDYCDGKGLFYFFELIKYGYDIKNFYTEDEEKENEE